MQFVMSMSYSLAQWVDVVTGKSNTPRVPATMLVAMGALTQVLNYPVYAIIPAPTFDAGSGGDAASATCADCIAFAPQAAKIAVSASLVAVSGELAPEATIEEETLIKSVT